MKNPKESSPEHTHDPMVEIHAILARLHAEGAMDEEGPFIASLLRQIERQDITPAEALKHLHAKMASRNSDH